MPEEMHRIIQRLQADEARRKSVQGRGRPIVSALFKGYRIVAVGSRVFWGRWNTFEEFLLYYLRQCFGAAWMSAEEQKSPAERHVVLNWIALFREQSRGDPGGPNEVLMLPKTGASTALLALAYNLYLLAHNVELQRRLLKRLKRVDQFGGAYYETLVVAWFILAGYEVTMLDEVSGHRRNCEFTARAPSGRTFSVEAKARGPGKGHTDVGHQLWEALKKDADHDRIIFIDLNTPDSPSDQLRDTVSEAIRSREGSLTIERAPAPPAYVFVTNHPYHYNLQKVGTERFMVGEGFKIPDFGTVRFTSLIDAFKAEQRHADVMAVFDAFGSYNVPSTFDGELPEVAYGGVRRRWLLEEEYDLQGLGVASRGVLKVAWVNEANSTATLVFRLPTGETRVVDDGLSKREVEAYQRHPESFFGMPADRPAKVEDPFSLFRFFYDSYKSTPRAKMLEFFAAAPDLENLKRLPDEELRLEYCNRHAIAAMQRGFGAQWQRQAVAPESAGGTGGR